MSGKGNLLIPVLGCSEWKALHCKTLSLFCDLWFLKLGIVDVNRVVETKSPLVLIFRADVVHWLSFL